MKIIYAPFGPVPSLAANSVHAMKMSQALADLGHQVTLITKHKGSLAIPTDPYTFYGVKSNFNFRQFYCLARTRGLVIHGLAITCAAYFMRVNVIYTRCLITAYVAACLGHTVIYERHDSFDNKPPFDQKIFEKLIQHKNLKSLVVISHALADHLCQQHGLLQNKIIIAPDAADPVDETNHSSSFERHAGRPVVGYIGHLYPGRGIDIILALAVASPGIDFHIVGGIPKDVAFWKDKIHHLPNLILHGHVSPARTGAFMMNCDILLAPYQRSVEVSGGGGNTVQWMSPLKIFEYMSSGKPMICSDLPVLHEILEDGETALLCPPDNLAAWQIALQKLCENRVLAEQLGKKAKEKFLAQYTWKKRAEFVLDSTFTK